MNNSSKPILLSTKFLVSVFLAMTFLFNISSGTTTQAKTLNTLIKIPESTPGGLTITWYSAKRFTTSSTTQRAANHSLTSFLDFSGFTGWFTEDNTAGQIDETKSDEAYKNLDRSVCLGTDNMTISSLKDIGWSPVDNSTVLGGSSDSYVWGEVQGYIKMPKTGCLVYIYKNNYNADFRLSIYGAELGKWGSDTGDYAYNMYTLLGDTSYLINKDTLIPFSFRIGNRYLDPSKPNRNVSLGLYTVDGDKWFYPEAYGKPLPVNSFYAKLSLQDMQKFFVFNPSNYTLTLRSAYNFPVDNYEYGIVNGDVNEASVGNTTGFQPLKAGVNYLTPDSGTIIIRDKNLKTYYISAGKASLYAPRSLAVTKRTSSTASLSWQEPLQEVPQGYVIPYDIYRKPVVGENLFSFNNTLSVEEPSKVGITTALNFIDKGLGYDTTYEYFVKAQYPTGFSSPSDAIRSDSVAI